VVGEASHGAAGVEAALQLRPDIVLMDVQMAAPDGAPALNGVQATAELIRRWPEARVIILTTFDRDDYVYEGVRAGAMGYLLKDTPADRLVATIRRVHAGEPFIQPEIASRALRDMMRASASTTSVETETLSEREREVLVLLAQGASNREIAAQLVITEGTVKNHVSNILGKLQAENRTQAADIARKRGLV
jgi:DNA-binding NarL/FixJ family response regulator